MISSCNIFTKKCIMQQILKFSRFIVGYSNICYFKRWASVYVETHLLYIIQSTSITRFLAQNITVSICSITHPTPFAMLCNCLISFIPCNAFGPWFLRFSMVSYLGALALWHGASVP